LENGCSGKKLAGLANLSELMGGFAAAVKKMVKLSNLADMGNMWELGDLADLGNLGDLRNLAALGKWLIQESLLCCENLCGLRKPC
jgi:hypothetical protein